MNPIGQQIVTQDKEHSLTLVEVLNVASSGYQDDFLKEYYHEETGQLNPAGSGDTLAEFIVLEIRDTFDANLLKTEQLNEVCRVMRRAISNVESVIEAVEKVAPKCLHEEVDWEPAEIDYDSEGLADLTQFGTCRDCHKKVYLDISQSIRER